MDYPPQYYFIALGAIVGFIAMIQKRLPRNLWLLPFFLSFTLIIEIIAYHMSERGQTNAALYNFSSVAAITYYMYLMLYIIHSVNARRVIWAMMILYDIISLVNIFFVQKMETFHTMTYSLGCLKLVVLSMYYFFELFQVPRAVDLKKEPVFWIVAGLLFYYICSLPIIGALYYLFTFPDVIASSLEQIINILNVLLYSLFTIGLLCKVSFRRSML